MAKKKPAAALDPVVQDFLDRFAEKTDDGTIRETFTAVTSLIGPPINRYRARADRADALGRLIHEIVSGQHDTSARKVIDQLRGQQGLGVIEDVSDADEAVTWVSDSGALKDTSFAAIASRVKKARRSKKSG